MLGRSVLIIGQCPEILIGPQRRDTGTLRRFSVLFPIRSPVRLRRRAQWIVSYNFCCQSPDAGLTSNYEAFVLPILFGAISIACESRNVRKIPTIPVGSGPAGYAIENRLDSVNPGTLAIFSVPSES